jgi:LysM repeat protein
MRAVRMLVAVVVIALVLVNEASGAQRSNARYVVSRGDTLTGIADRYGISLSRLAQANRLDWRAPLPIGTVLKIPGRPAPASQPSAEVYVVQLGDTLGGIAGRYGVPLSELASTNGLDPAGVLLAGAKLHIPGVSHPGVTITVAAGDTLSGLAARYGISLGSLTAANHIDVSAPLLIGQHLSIPDAAGPISPLDVLTRSQVDPYVRASAGLDLSYPACGRSIAPGGGFVIVGLNSGRPFTANPCFSEEYAAAAQQGLPSVYVNSAYAPSMLRQISGDCGGAATALSLSRAEQRAYELGCSEASAAIGALAGTRVAAIWVDVEAANTWSRHPELNRATVEGFLATLLSRQSAGVGVYASPVTWADLTGDWRSLTLPEWIATGPVNPPGCPPPFAAGPVWLGQHTPDKGRTDADTAC